MYIKIDGCKEGLCLIHGKCYTFILKCNVLCSLNYYFFAYHGAECHVVWQVWEPPPLKRRKNIFLICRDIELSLNMEVHKMTTASTWYVIWNCGCAHMHTKFVL